MENELELLNNFNEFMPYFRSSLKDVNVEKFYNEIYPLYSKLTNLDDLRKENFGYYILKDKFDQVFGLIKDIEFFYIDLSSVKNNIFGYVRVLNGFDMWFQLDEIFSKISSEYKKYIDIKRNLDYFDNQINVGMNIEEINLCVKKYLEYINELKKDNLFINDYFSKCIGEFYRAGYDLMKLEYASIGSSKLFDYFKENPHDYWYIIKFITNECDMLKDSINYVSGLDELIEIMEYKKNNDDDNFLEERIVTILAANNYPKEYKKMIFDKLMAFEKEMETLKSSIGGIEEKDLLYDLFEGKIGIGKLISGSFSNQLELYKLSTRRLEILDEAKKLVIDTCFLIDDYIFREDLNVLLLKIKN